jgi:hypothetical protein
MRGEETRVRVEGFFEARLARTLMPAVLGIVISLANCATGSAVAAHDPPSVQAHAAEEPVGDFDLRSDLDAYDDSVPRPEPLEFESPWPEPESSAADIKQAVASCNIADLRRAILSYDELVSLMASGSPVEADYTALVDEWIAATTREFCVSGKPGGTSNLGEPVTGNYVAAPAGEKWKQPIMLCEVTLRRFDFASGVQANEIITFTLVELNHSWRILLRVSHR